MRGKDNPLTRQESVRLEQAVGIHWQEFEALWQDELTCWGLVGTMLAITGQNYCHLVREVLTNILVRHRQGCSHNYRHNIQKEQNLTFEICTITNSLFILIYTPSQVSSYQNFGTQV